MLTTEQTKSYTQKLKAKGYTDSSISAALNAFNSGDKNFSQLLKKTSTTTTTPKVTAGGDYANNIVKNGTGPKTTPQNARKISDMSTDANGNILEKYSDGTVRTYDKNGNLLSDTITQNEKTNNNEIQNNGKKSTQRDYQTDVSSGDKRVDEIVYNMKQYAETNGQLFKNRANFEKMFHYNERSDSQKDLLDKAWENYNKFGLNSAENSFADSASEVATKKANERIQAATDNMLAKKKNADNVIKQMQPKYQNMFNKLEDYYQKSMADMSKLRAMANQYYENMTNLYSEQSAGESAAIASRMSAQGMGYTAIGSATTGNATQRSQRFNNLLDSHINRMKELQDVSNSIVNTVIPNMKGITDSEKQMLQDYANSLNGWLDNVNEEVMSGINAKWKPYEDLTNAKVAGAGEVSTSQAKAVNKQETYSAGNEKQKIGNIINNLILMQGQDINLADEKSPYYQAILEAVRNNPNDMNRALYEAENKLKASGVKVKVNNKKNDDEGGDDEFDENDLDDFGIDDLDEFNPNNK